MCMILFITYGIECIYLRIFRGSEWIFIGIDPCFLHDFKTFS